jgi:hypothetical protein
VFELIYISFNMGLSHPQAKITYAFKRNLVFPSISGVVNFHPYPV